ncbi:hypothetical protein QFZ82_000432 [Streptomyces sp. V4I23]|uniref:hypothetical protein n=1 Tax=Streptomyces sp. V4I23 TaxID=3042282 RepID=UPI0027826A3A|nr:hypothetical protein [Streptomyces sp. V4I23]MDQ1005650.1 hypothetical protein [Streptomyces sp. V4I23]MDQ1005809.1 hypothetical protein [Streptomyces sp. V4I23]MDQ1005947.1 hypothetical protein [Streptomyces sp. V4I23]
MADYSADVNKILASSENLGDAARLHSTLGPEFEKDMNGVYGWWGEEGVDDPFADVVGPAWVEERDTSLGIMQKISDGLDALYRAVVDQAAAVQKPQTDALDWMGGAGSADPDAGTKR